VSHFNAVILNYIRREELQYPLICSDDQRR